MRKQKKNAINRILKRVAAFTVPAVAIVLCVALVVSSIWNDAIDAQASDTLLGIEKLRNQIVDSGKEYTILEIVPNKYAAEIGFMVNGCEPILRVWDEENNEWISWKEGLFKVNDDPKEREKYIEGLKTKLREYYEKTGNKWGKDYPVYGEGGTYAESKDPKDGYEKISAPSLTKTGYFEFGGADPKYQLAFERQGKNNLLPNVLYYEVDEASVKELRDELRYNSIESEVDLESLLEKLDDLPDDMFVYEKSDSEYKPALWSQAKDRYKEQVKAAYNYEQLVNEASIDAVGIAIEGEEESDNTLENSEDEEGEGDETESDEEGEDIEGEGDKESEDVEGEENKNKENNNEEDKNKEDEDVDESNGETNFNESNKSKVPEESDDNYNAKNSVRISSSTSRWIKMSFDGETEDPDSTESDPDKVTPDTSKETDPNKGTDPDKKPETEEKPETGEDSGTGEETDPDEETPDPNDENKTNSGKDKKPNSGTGHSTASGNSYGSAKANDNIEEEKYPELYIVKFKVIEGSTKDKVAYYVRNPQEIRESSSDKYGYSFVDLSGETKNTRKAKKANAVKDTNTKPITDDEKKSDSKPVTDDEKESDSKPATDDEKEPDNKPVIDDENGSGTTSETDNNEVYDDVSKADGAKFVKFAGTSDDDSYNKTGSGDDSGDTAGSDGESNNTTGTDDESNDKTGTDDEPGDTNDTDDNEDSDKTDVTDDEENLVDDKETEAEEASDYEDVTYDADNSNDKPNLKSQEYTFLGKVIYCKNTFKSNEWFKKYVLNMDESEFDSFSINVITLTPEELNGMETLPEFDFLYLNSGLRVIPDDNNTDEGGSDSADEGDGTEEGEGDGGEEGDEGNGGSVAEIKEYGADNDLSDKVLQYLVSRAVTGALPCLVDGTILYAKEGSEDSQAKAIKINEDLKKTNIFRLSAIMCQGSLSEWYERNGGNLKGASVDDLLKGVVEDADKNFVTDQVYCRFDDVSIINKDFPNATIYRDGQEMNQGFQKVLDEILLDNTYRAADSSGNYQALSTDIGQSTAVRHIINYQNRRKVEPKERIKVLEIQPAKVDKPELTLEQLQAWAPGVKEADITVMTTAEFIGKIDKLNELYDLIYIGTSEDHLNVKFWDRNWDEKRCFTSNDDSYRTPESEKRKGKVSAGTVFNDSNMDGLIYYNIGDLRAASVLLAGQLDTEYVNPNDRWGDVFAYNYYRYGGNDITKEKKEALLSFLDGSYPVIISDDFIEQPVTVFGDADYMGPRVNLSVGEYTREDLDKMGDTLAKDVSSVKVKKGYRITIFDGNNFDGNSITLDENSSNFRLLNRAGKDWNNIMYSAIVERVEDETPVKRIDEDHIDNCTNLYDFVTAAMEKDYINFYTWSEIEDDSELFKFYLNRPKVSVEQTFVNGEKKNENGSEIYYVGPGNDGRYRLEFRFAIHNEGAASATSRYLCRLYIDINSDGKFSAEEEVPDINLTHNGGYVSSDALYIDRQYVLTRGIPDGYKGLLPWKVEITQADNDNIYASMSGYTKLDGMEKEKIDVIQIKRAANWAGEAIDLDKEFNDVDAIYHKLLYGGVVDGVEYKGISDDYEINVDCMTIAEFEEMFDPENEEKYNPDCMSNYNMLILGFSDMYENFSGDSENGPMGAIVDFINSGKSVLFAHDTTSFVNYAHWGVMGRVNKSNPSSTDGAVQARDDFARSLNQYIRGLVGMDRYGILDSNGDILRQGQVLKKGSGSYDTIVSSGKDVAYEPKSNRERTVPQVHGYTYHTINSKDKTYNDGSEQKTDYTPAELDPSRDGIFSNTFRNIRYDRVFYEWGGNDFGDLEASWNGAASNMNVTQVNKGQITEYPYHLPEKFAIATTHGQYYELDFTADADGDGQSDLVVWYCLADRNGNGNDNTIYSESPNDVRNNYYIYNKGNVTYTGMGHSAGSDMPYTVDEAKLFINTIIAAYQAGVKQPYITVLKNGLPESAELKLMYRYYDANYSGASESLDYMATPEVYEKIYFRVQDLNFVKGTRKIATHVFYETDSGTEEISIGGNQITVNRFDDYIFNAEDGSPVIADDLKSNGIYYIMVPKSVLEQCDEGLNLYFEAQTTITTNTVNQNKYVTDKVYAKLKVLKAFLFDLE